MIIHSTYQIERIFVSCILFQMGLIYISDELSTPDRATYPYRALNSPSNQIGLVIFYFFLCYIWNYKQHLVFKSASNPKFPIETRSHTSPKEATWCCQYRQQQQQVFIYILCIYFVVYVYTLNFFESCFAFAAEIMETREASPAHFLIKIESFSLFDTCGIDKYETKEFVAGEYKWFVRVYRTFTMYKSLFYYEINN